MNEAPARPLASRRRAVTGTAMLVLALAIAFAVGPSTASRAGPGGDDNKMVPADDPMIELLSGIDFIPGRGAFDDILGETAPAELVDIARGRHSSMKDAGLRIRAYRALALYPGAGTEAALREAVEEHGELEGGVDTLYLRAAMDSLARVAREDAVAALAAMLEHPTRDVRAAAALAMGETAADTAIAVLRARLPEEPELQVRLAIAEALRRLDEPLTAPSDPPTK
jgi:HEAT repeats